jgi:hypothetical protein
LKILVGPIRERFGVPKVSRGKREREKDKECDEAFHDRPSVYNDLGPRFLYAFLMKSGAQ